MADLFMKRENVDKNRTLIYYNKDGRHEEKLERWSASTQDVVVRAAQQLKTDILCWTILGVVIGGAVVVRYGEPSKFV